MYLSIEIILNGVADRSQHHQLNCPKAFSFLTTKGFLHFNQNCARVFTRHWANGLS
jgi:hypothetical protein